MESARALLCRRLPHLIQFGGTASPSVSDERLCASYMHEWPGFEAQVLAACNLLDLTAQVSVTDAPEGELYFVGSELGLTTRFARHVCDAVAKALSVTNLSLRFGDMQSLLTHPSTIPDVTLALFAPATAPSRDAATLIAAGELKTWWTVNLAEWTTLPRRTFFSFLEPYIGQLVSYMREYGLRYGFLSTYKSTIFVRRDDDFRFSLSLPVSQDATNPSLRECFAGFSVLAAEDPEYREKDDMDARLLRSPTEPGMLASMRPSPYRSRVGDSTQSLTPTTASENATYHITPDSIIVGDNGVAAGFVQCVELLSSPRLKREKAVYEVESRGARYIAKCWSYDRDVSAAKECWMYERLYELRPGGFEVFPRLAFFGQIICSSKFPEGNFLLLEKRPGKPLFGMWSSLSSAEKAHVYSECSSAIRILRSISIRVLDAGKHNVLYDRETGTVTMVDFETVVELSSPEEIRTLNPELYAIFADTDMRQYIHGG